jgi:hypothetical protein
MGTNSFIYEGGTGSLKILGGQSKSSIYDGENMLDAVKAVRFILYTTTALQN